MGTSCKKAPATEVFWCRYRIRFGAHGDVTGNKWLCSDMGPGKYTWQGQTEYQPLGATLGKTSPMESLHAQLIASPDSFETQTSLCSECEVAFVAQRPASWTCSSAAARMIRRRQVHSCAQGQQRSLWLIYIQARMQYHVVAHLMQMQALHWSLVQTSLPCQQRAQGSVVSRQAATGHHAWPSLYTFVQIP